MSKRAYFLPWFYAGLMLALVALFVRLAVWQYHRAHEREALIRAADVAVRSPATRLAPGATGALPRFAHVYAQGRYDSARQVLLAEMPQPDGEATGFQVLTPLRLAGGAVLLVDRGWIPADGKDRPRADLAAPPGTVRAAGYLANLPVPGLRLGSDDVSARGRWPEILLYPRWNDLAGLYGPGLVRRLILLAPDATGGYDRAWQLRPEHGPGENYSYMAQWLGMAGAVFVIWLVLTIRRRRARADGGR